VVVVVEGRSRRRNRSVTSRVRMRGVDESLKGRVSSINV
jgi:hypothetical protein